jgi:SYP7 family syntaxin
MHNVQDEGLDVIAAGLTTLKDMAGDINEVRLLWHIFFYTTEDMLQAASRGCPIQMDAKLSWLDNLQELNKQMPLIDEVDTKVDKAAADLKNTNVKLKETLIKMRSNRNFCVDIILIVIILGIGGYLYTLLR